MKQAVAIRHLAFEDLGTLAPLLLERRYAIAFREAGVDALDDLRHLDPDLLIVLGGPIGAYEEAIYPFLTSELKLIEARLRAGRPTLGICLGAQLMARALGARVYPGPAKEIGWSPLSLTQAGFASPLSALAPDLTAVLHWHGDTFDLPKDATLLASTELTPHQAYAVGSHTLALQFHAEVDPTQIERWLIGHTVEIGAAKLSVPTLREDSQRFGPTLARQGRQVFEAWLDGLAPHG